MSVELEEESILEVLSFEVEEKMPIGGFVVTVVPGNGNTVMEQLSGISQCDVYVPADDNGKEVQHEENIVITLDTKTSNEMEGLVEEIKKIDGVISVDLVYLNVEDEIEE
ncbi:Periplasmic nitrate reductase, subunit NapD [Dissulfuribacter thermophilus]|uniref:Chaperone NapD n=1 Tax=Dissulfuribacter thermophilus TaxID=1156395 RepID=A0A1B9F2T4_9BACT|nr:chaperone NapD [Dissulfuribacter thermophilus]OCC14249.1 Periplasmic nitrate reductase, subunit NapD [Dissulfuribacter thermophilus]